MCRLRILPLIFASLALSRGCGEISSFTANRPGESPPADVDASDAAGGSAIPGGPNAPVVTLTVSNPTPLVLEQVQFTCLVVGGDSEGVVFAFQPADRRLLVDGEAGVASIIIQEADLVGLVVTCTGTNEHGTGAPSAPQTVQPIDPLEPIGGPVVPDDPPDNPIDPYDPASPGDPFP